MARLIDQIREAVAAFAGLRTPPALIGGLALAAHQVVRATRDVDFLVDADDAERLHALLLGLGYQSIHRSEDAANYLRGDEGLDLLYAHRPEARRLLAAAQERETGMGRLRVISAEGLVGFKLQGFVNDASRMRDLDATPSTKPATQSKPAPLAGSAGVPYAPPMLPAPIDAWIDLMEVVEALCPRWPERALSIGRDYRL